MENGCDQSQALDPHPGCSLPSGVAAGSLGSFRHAKEIDTALALGIPENCLLTLVV